MENVDWTSVVVVLSAGFALGAGIGALWLCARAWDMGYRAGRLDERYRVDAWRLTEEAR